MKYVIVLGMVCLFTSSALSAVYVEDFEYTEYANLDYWHDGLNNWFSFTNPDGVFEHLIKQSDHLSSIPIVEHEELISHTGRSLFPESARDTITFNLQPGQYVESVSVDYYNIILFQFYGMTVISTEGEYSWEITQDDYAQWKTMDTSGMDLGQITQLKLPQASVYFDNITINVVPEPATVLLLALGGLMLKRNRAR